MDKNKFNASGCLDMTSYKAINHISQMDKEKEDFKSLRKVLMFIIHKSGFRLEGNIVLRNKKSGRIYK